MATSTKSVAPDTAVKIWCDGLYLYAELPGDPPYVIAESVCEAGLWKMLNLLRDKALEHPIASAKALRMVSVRQPTRIEKVQATDEQRALARDVLRKVGIL